MFNYLDHSAPNLERREIQNDNHIHKSKKYILRLKSSDQQLLSKLLKKTGHYKYLSRSALVFFFKLSKTMILFIYPLQIYIFSVFQLSEITSREMTITSELPVKMERFCNCKVKLPCFNCYVDFNFS